ncbi:MAG: hypothetical protein J0L88_06885 [Xanthomonadales bacterium]|nr:hypothetical protein [Xanthomonadales bacterium]
MQLVHDRAEGYFFIRACRPDAITIIDRELHASFIIAPDRIVEDWPAQSAATLDLAAMEAVLALDPELVLLGSGARQEFPPPTVLLPLLCRGIGVEVMDNAAASRTYNLLAAEGRRVVAAFMLAAAPATA